MSSQLHERHNRNNRWGLAHDAFGSYMDKNGIREYTVTTALVDGATAAVPRGSVVRTTHPTGRDQVFIVDGSSKLQAQSGSGGADISGVAPTGYYDFLRAPVDGDFKTFDGVVFTWVTNPASVNATHPLAPTEVENPDNTLLGEALFNMVEKLNASASGSVNIATYSTNATHGFKNATRIIVTHDTEGVAGESYTLDDANDSFATRSGDTLSGGVDAQVSNKEYSVILTQTTTGAPNTSGTGAGVIVNELGGAAPTLARTSPGLYTITKTGAFPAGKTFVQSGVFHDAATKVVSWSGERTSDDVVTLRVKETTYTAANDVTLANKEISAMNTPLIPFKIIVKG